MNTSKLALATAIMLSLAAPAFAQGIPPGSATPPGHSEDAKKNEHKEHRMERKHHREERREKRHERKEMRKHHEHKQEDKK